MGNVNGCNGKCSTAQYRSGCRQPPCKKAQAAYQRDLRARHAASNKNVVAIGRRGKTQVAQQSKPAETPYEPGPVELDVIVQCEKSALAEEQPGTVRMCRVLGRLLDDDTKMREWTSASRQLQKLLVDLNAKPKRKSAGYLHRVSAMTAASRHQGRQAQ